MFPLFLFLWTLVAAKAQYANYYYPQTYSYGGFPYSGGYANGGYANGGYANGGYANGGYANGGYANGFPYPQYGTMGQYGWPMQIQQPYYGAVPQGWGGSTVTAAQTTTTTVPGSTQVVLPNQGLVLGQGGVMPQVYQAASVPMPNGPILTQTVPGTSVVQSNTVVEVDEAPPLPPQNPNPPAHFDYYAYGRDAFDGTVDHEGRNIGGSQRPFFLTRAPSYVRNGSPFKVVKPEHFEYSGFGRSEPMQTL